MRTVCLSHQLRGQAALLAREDRQGSQAAQSTLVSSVIKLQGVTFDIKYCAGVQGCHGFPDNTTLSLDDALPANQSYFTYRCRLRKLLGI